jgi:hypothetical protein
VSVFYLQIIFCDSIFLLEPSPYHLNKNDSVELHVEGNTELPVDFYEPALLYNYEKYTERLKVIVSDRPFEIYPLKLDSLPDPPIPGQERGTMQARRGIGRSRNFGSFEGWFTSTIDIVTYNPSFNTIPAYVLKQMLDDEITSPFAEGLFFDANFSETNPLNIDIKLKPEITIKEGNADNLRKNAIVDIANWWSRRKRNKYYENIARRFPERTKIVSEGDSWFQHPLVYDIIDDLSKIYAVRCVAAAADTLSNYFSHAKTRGEYFLDVLTEVKPAFFLISGGGNDILGSQFREFLIDAPYEKGLKGDSDGSKFLKGNFQIQLDTLMNIYSAIFRLLRSQFPVMKTIVHGYDYPVHLDSPDKGWLGRYMIEKGISDPNDRRTVIRYIMDQFNETLKGLVQDFPGSVYYLDLRGTVHYKENEINQWYDEIHPNLDGFQLIGLKFMNLIEDLKAVSNPA